MRVGLLTEGGFPYAIGQGGGWCRRLVGELGEHEFDVYALSLSRCQEAAGWTELPGHVRRVGTAALWDGGTGTSEAVRPGRDRGGLAPPGRAPARSTGPTGERRRTRPGRGRERGSPANGFGGTARWGRRGRRRFAEHFADLTQAISTAGGEADRFASGLYGLAELARESGGLPAALRSEEAVRALERACRAPGALRGAYGAGAYHAQVTDLLAVADRLERALRPLSLAWYGESCDGASDGDPGLSAVDLCHAAAGPGVSALPGLLAKRFFDTPLLVSEYGVRLREHYLAGSAGVPGGTWPAPGPWSAAGSWDASVPWEVAGRPLGLLPTEQNGTGCVPPGAAAGAPVRTLLAAFHRRLAAEVYARADLVTAGNAHARRWQLRCGADPERIRVVHPGLDPGRAAQAGEGRAAEADDGRTLVWLGHIEPAKDIVGLLHAFARLRRAEPDARLRIVETGPVSCAVPGPVPVDVPDGGAGTGWDGAGPRAAIPRPYGSAGPHGCPGPFPAAGTGPDAAWLAGCAVGAAGAGTGRAAGYVTSSGPGFEPGSHGYLLHCRALAAHLFPDEAEHAGAVGDNPVTFEELGGPEAPSVAEVHAAATLVVRSSVVEGFPVGLIDAMFCGRAVVATDVGAVREVVGGTGLVVPARNPRALADACLALLGDAERRARLGAAARSRALALFTADAQVAAFRGIYRELRPDGPARRTAVPARDRARPRPPVGSVRPVGSLEPEDRPTTPHAADRPAAGALPVRPTGTHARNRATTAVRTGPTAARTTPQDAAPPPAPPASETPHRGSGTRLSEEDT